MKPTEYFLGIVYDAKDRDDARKFFESESPDFKVTKVHKVRNKNDYRIYGHRKDYE